MAAQVLAGAGLRSHICNGLGDLQAALAEGAGAAALAAAYRIRDGLRGKKIGLVCSGGNTSIEHLKQALETGV